MSRWIEFETDGALERISNTENAGAVGPINIRYCNSEGIYDLMMFSKGTHWMYEYSFTSLSEAQSKARSLVSG